MLQYNEVETPTPPPPERRKSRWRKIVYGVVGVLVVGVLAAVIIITSFPNLILHSIIAPKLKALVTEKLGSRYGLEMGSIEFSSGKDSLVITGVRIADNGSPLAPGDSTAILQRFTTDTIIISGLDYWKLMAQKGLYANAISIHSPKVFLRPGSLPKFDTNMEIFPGFLPSVSSSSISIDNAQISLSENPEQVHSNKGVHIARASINLDSFFVDRATLRKGSPTFFCKRAKFHAEDVDRIDSMDAPISHIDMIDGDLLDSTCSVAGLTAWPQLLPVKQASVDRLDFSGLDWQTVIAGHGFHAKHLAITAPTIQLREFAEAKSYASHTNATTDTSRLKGSDLMPLPPMLPSLEIGSIDVAEGRISIPATKGGHAGSVKHIAAALRGFSIGATTPFSDVSTLFSKSASMEIPGETSLSTSSGKVGVSNVSYTKGSLHASNIRMDAANNIAHSIGVRKVRVRSAELQGVDLWKLLNREGIVVSKLIINQPDIYLDDSTAPPVHDLCAMLRCDPLAGFQRLKTFPLPTILPSAQAGSVTVAGGVIHGIHLFDAEVVNGSGDSITHLNLNLGRFLLDETSWTKNRGKLFSRTGTFSIGDATQYTPGSLYRYTEGGIKGDLGKRTLTIESLLVHPMLPEDSFHSPHNYRIVRLDAQAPQIVAIGVDYQRLLTGSGLFADSIILENWEFDIYGNKTLPSDTARARIDYPHELFQMIHCPLGLQALVVRNGEITFRERWPHRVEPAMIALEAINARVGPISNDKSPGYESRETNVIGDIKIMGEAPLHFDMKYALMDPRFHLDLKAKLDQADAALLNQYLEESEPFMLSGSVHSADFDFQVRDSMITGKLVPIYDSLRVKFFLWDKFPPGLVSMIANSLIMRTHNTPERDNPVETGTISAKLDRYENLFWSLWIPIRNSVSGIVNIPEWVW